SVGSLQQVDGSLPGVVGGIEIVYRDRHVGMGRGDPAYDNRVEGRLLDHRERAATTTGASAIADHAGHDRKEDNEPEGKGQHRGTPRVSIYVANDGKKSQRGVVDSERWCATNNS